MRCNKGSLLLYWIRTMAAPVWHSLHASASKQLCGPSRSGSTDSSTARCSFQNLSCLRLFGARAPKIAMAALATHHALGVQGIHALPSQFMDAQTKALESDIGADTIFQAVTSGVEAVFSHLPVTTFTILAVLVAIYHLFKVILVRIFSNYLMVSPPVNLGEITAEELRAYDGSDPSKPLLMAIKGHIYDVSNSRIFYGPRGPYSLFAGREASRALAKLSFEQHDLNADLQGLTPQELDTLSDWEFKFSTKYPRVGYIAGSLAAVSKDRDDVPGGMVQRRG